MRIVCQSCAAPYAIDDALIAANGVSAQCPRCQCVQWVERGAPLDAASRPAAPRPRAFLGKRALQGALALVSLTLVGAVIGGGGLWFLRKSRPPQPAPVKEVPLPAAVQAVLPRWQMM